MAFSGCGKWFAACVRDEAGGEVEQSRKCHARFDTSPWVVPRFQAYFWHNQCQCLALTPLGMLHRFGMPHLRIPGCRGSGSVGNITRGRLKKVD